MMRGVRRNRGIIVAPLKHKKYWWLHRIASEILSLSEFFNHDVVDEALSAVSPTTFAKRIGSAEVLNAAGAGYIPWFHRFFMAGIYPFGSTGAAP